MFSASRLSCLFIPREDVLVPFPELCQRPLQSVLAEECAGTEQEPDRVLLLLEASVADCTSSLGDKPHQSSLC